MFKKYVTYFDYLTKSLINFTIKDTDQNVYIPIDKAKEIFMQRFQKKYKSLDLFNER